MKNNTQLDNLWKKAPDEFPKCSQDNSVACLVKVKGRFQINYYNGYYGVWDDADNDDCEFPDSQVLEWIQLEFEEE